MIYIDPKYRARLPFRARRPGVIEKLIFGRGPWTFRYGNAAVALPPGIDGNFHLVHPRQPMLFTGERMTSAVGGQIEFEHYHRYCFARDLCAGRDVLDVASGEGYGTALLAGVAGFTTGVEIDAEFGGAR